MAIIKYSTISRIEWRDGTLSVWHFLIGKVDYYGVPESIYYDFLAAKSKRSFFRKRIKPCY